MRMLPWMMLSVLAVSCAAPRTVPRAPVVAPLETQAPRAKIEPRVRADADRTRTKAPSSVPVEPVRSTGGNIQDRVIIEIVEVEVPIERPAPVANDSWVPPNYSYYPYDDGRWSYRRRSRFPVASAVGFGLGAFVGHLTARALRCW